MKPRASGSTLLAWFGGALAGVLVLTVVVPPVLYLFPAAFPWVALSATVVLAGLQALRLRKPRWLAWLVVGGVSVLGGIGLWWLTGSDRSTALALLLVVLVPELWPAEPVESA